MSSPDEGQRTRGRWSRGKFRAIALLPAAIVMASQTMVPVHAADTVDRTRPVAAAVATTQPKDTKKHKKHKKKKHKPKSIEDMIREVFGPRADEALRIARCESSLDPNQVNSIGATGLFQIRAGMHSWRVKKVHGKSLTDPWTNVKVAYSLMKDEGWGPWVCAHRLGISSGHRGSSSGYRANGNRSSHQNAHGTSGVWQPNADRRGPRFPRSPSGSPSMSS